MRVLFTDVIERLLARLYQRPALDGLQLFRYYSYRPDYVERTLARVKEISAAEDGGRIKIEGIGDTFPHPGGLYDRMDSLLAEEPADVPCAWIHGDLNLANILRDATGNTWMIDYYWTRIGHAWQDIAKLENDLKFIILKPGHDDALTGAVAWERHLIAHADLAVPLAPLPDALARDPDLARLHVAISLLRQLAGSLALEAGQQPPLFPRPYWIAQLRYSAHTLGFDECNVRQQRHALASTCLLAEAILGRSA